MFCWEKLSLNCSLEDYRIAELDHGPTGIEQRFISRITLSRFGYRDTAEVLSFPGFKAELQ